MVTRNTEHTQSAQLPTIYNATHTHGGRAHTDPYFLNSLADAKFRYVQSQKDLQKEASLTLIGEGAETMVKKQSEKKVQEKSRSRYSNKTHLTTHLPSFNNTYYTKG